MKEFIVLKITFTLWPLVVLGNIASEFVDEKTGLPKFCGNGTLLLHSRKSLELERNSIVSQSIKCISLESPSLDMEEGSFDGVPNLMYLDLQGGFADIDSYGSNYSKNVFSFGNHSKIRIMKFRNTYDRPHNNYDNLYNDYDGPYKKYDAEPAILVSGVYPQLEYLDLSNLGINKISSPFSNPFPNLTHLDISGNQFVHADFTNNMDFTCRALLHLDLSNNRVTELSPMGLSNLLSLTLDKNEIENIGEVEGLNLRGLKNLVNLSVGENQIEAIGREAFEDTINLQHLNLSMNLLSVLNPEVIAHLSFLEVLILDGNKLDSVPSGTFQNLTTLSLNCNHISFLSINSFCNLPSLRKLFLKGNIIRNINIDAFQNLKLLQELDLSDNQLHHMPMKWCQPLNELQHLDLSGNDFTSLDSVFYSCSAFHMKRLYFKGNPLTYINASTFQGIPKGTTVYLNIGSKPTPKLCNTPLREEQYN